MNSLMIGLTALICLIVVFGYTIFTSINFDTDGNYCSVCKWNCVYMNLLDYNDPGYGHNGALEEIWNQANYGKNVNLEWYENYRLKYDLDDVDSFTLINYSNSRPSSPTIKHMDTGNISDVVFSHDVGYPDLVYVNPIINVTEYYWHIWEIGETLSSDWKDGNPFPFNYSHTYVVYKQKSRAWHWKYKDAVIIDLDLNPNHLENNLVEWDNYYNAYQRYINNDGVDLGDDYWI